MKNKNIITILRDFSKLALIVSIASLPPACGGGGGGGNKNKIPRVSISYSFNNDGKVNYTITGADDDGQVTELKATYNNEAPASYKNNPVSFSKEITAENNTLEAIAVDNSGAKSTSVKNTFQVPNRTDAHNQIKQLLDTAKGFTSYESDPLGKTSVYLEDDVYGVDFLIKRTDNRYSVINYVAPSESFLDRYGDQLDFNNFFVDNLYSTSSLKEEIAKKTDEFIRAGYMTKFE